MKKIIIILFSLSLGAQESRYTYHTEILPNGKVYRYAIDHSPEAKAKIDAQFGPSQKADTSSIGY